MSRTAFVHRLGDDALDLAKEAYAYQQRICKDQKPEIFSLEELSTTAELLMITTRLAEVISWVYAVKALHTGESLGPNTFSELEPLANLKCCQRDPYGYENEQPEPVKRLLVRSHRLLKRAVHLDELIREQERA